jgi:hypothetical protein
MSAVMETRPGPAPMVPVPATVAGRVTQVCVVRAEWTKLRALRSTWWCALIAIVLVVGLGAAIGFAGIYTRGHGRCRGWPGTASTWPNASTSPPGWSSEAQIRRTSHNYRLHVERPAPCRPKAAARATGSGLPSTLERILGPTDQLTLATRKNLTVAR